MTPNEKALFDGFKKLYELGFVIPEDKITGLYVDINKGRPSDDDEIVTEYWTKKEIDNAPFIKEKPNKISITDADGLGNMLPDYIQKDKGDFKFYLHIFKENGRFCIDYSTKLICLIVLRGKTLTLALLAMLIWVAENKKGWMV